MNQAIIYERDPKDNKKIINGYKILKIIGEGAYGKIKLSQKDGKLFAIKKFNKYLLRKKNKIYKNPDGTTKYQSLLEEVYRELSIHQNLDHPHIVKLYDIFDDDKRDKLYAVLEYAQNGQILNWDHKKQIFQAREFSEEQIKKYLKQTLEALQYLNQIFVCHRDIKPHNILLDEHDNIKLCDFGTAQQLQSANQRVKGTEGTFQFVAPECLRESKDTDIPGYNGFLSDIWGLGIVAYCMVEKKLPFQSDNMLELFKQIESKEIQMNYNGQAKQIIMKMLIRDTKQRPSAQELLQDQYFIQ
ncbi:hypothetical protein pb186bvf_015232 [Paramecium bursaria]